MYRIRFHGRGGQGMKTASRILGTAFFLQGYEVQDAPRYGAERRGAPIFAYVRADDQPINERGIITNPDLVIVADDSLVPVPAAGVLTGVDEHTVLLINSDESTDTWKHRLNLSCRVFTLPAEAEDRAELRFIGATCTAQMRNASIAAAGIFLAAAWVLANQFGISGLWVSFILYVCARALTLLFYFPGLRKSIA